MRQKSLVTTTIPAGSKPYLPRGGIRELFCTRADEVLLSGPAGTGKSRGCCEKLYLAALKYPGSRILIARKTRASLTETILVTLEEHVMPSGAWWKYNQKRRVRQSYELPNKSQIVVGGLDNVQRIMSSEYDMIYVPEARELTEDDWEMLSTRLRNPVMPYRQLIADTNPDAPGHWLKQRANRGQLQLIESRHEDNPTVTPEYLAKLDALTGVRFKRLRHGIWAAAENMVYPEWDPSVHLINRFLIPRSWTRYRSIDFGYENPFCCQWWAEDGDGRLFRYRELYGTHRSAVDWAHQIYEVGKGEQIAATITDHDAEARSELEAHMSHGAAQCGSDRYSWESTTAANKTVVAGIEKVRERLKRNSNSGEPRLFFLRDSLVERDPLLDELKKPCCTEEEIESYVWDRRISQLHGEVMLDHPLKKDDHGMDPLRYIVMYLDGPDRAREQLWGQRLTTR